jgi:hypothetical protein
MVTISTRDLELSPGFQFLQFLCTVLLQTFMVWKTCVLMAPMFIPRETTKYYKEQVFWILGYKTVFVPI